MSNEFYTNVTLEKGKILLRGYKNGKRIQERVPYKPYLFVPSKAETEYKTIHGDYVGRMDFDSIWEANKFCKEYADVEGFSIYGMQNYVYPFIFDNYPGDIQYDQNQISITSIDIETDAVGSFPNVELADKEITLITISNKGKMLTFGCQPYVPVEEDDIEDSTYILCKDEEDLLSKFLDAWESDRFAPDVVTGFNSNAFDIVYLVNRITRILGEDEAKRLSPWRQIKTKKVVDKFGKDTTQYELVGIALLDYMELFLKFGNMTLESYSLDHVAFTVLGQKKVDYGEYGSLGNLQQQNWNLYTYYNKIDVRLVDRLDEKMGLIGLILAMAYDSKINYGDAFTTVRLWDVTIHNYLLEQNIVVPPIKVPEIARKIPGGYVKEPHVGLHEWVVSFDVTSLYPNIIQTYNISHETYVGRSKIHYTMEQLVNGEVDTQSLIDQNVALTTNGLLFRRDVEGFYPALQRMFFEKRQYWKGLMKTEEKLVVSLEEAMLRGNDVQLELKTATNNHVTYDNKQQSSKIRINSAYGALLNSFYRWYNADFGEAITQTGQLTTRWIERKLNEYLNKVCKTTDYDYVIACDTDSAYIRLEKLVEMHVDDVSDKTKVIKFLDNVCEKALQPYIAKCFDELSKMMNARVNTIIMKRECIGDRAIWRGAKNYILNVYNKEGVAYEKPKLKMMGIEAVKSSTPQVCRDAIKGALEVIMNESEEALQKYVENFRTDFYNMSFEQVAFPRSVSNLEQYVDRASIYTKGTPINSRASLIYNHWVKKKGVGNTYEPIVSGQKIKYAYLKMPNPIFENVVAAPGGKLPKEFGVDQYINFELQYEKTFLGPIQSITSVIGWQTEKRSTLDDFFA